MLTHQVKEDLASSMLLWGRHREADGRLPCVPGDMAGTGREHWGGSGQPWPSGNHLKVLGCL